MENFMMIIDLNDKNAIIDLITMLEKENDQEYEELIKKLLLFIT